MTRQTCLRGDLDRGKCGNEGLDRLLSRLSSVSVCWDHHIMFDVVVPKPTCLPLLISNNITWHALRVEVGTGMF